MVSRFEFPDTGVNIIVAAATLCHRNVIHSQDNIPSENQLFSFDARSQPACMDSPAPGDRPFCHSLNKNTCWLGQIKCPCEITVNQKTFNTRPERFLLQQESPCCI